MFVDGLVAAAADPGGRIDVVLTVRADYYGRFAGDQRLASAIAANQVLVGPMTAEEYRRAITRPAQRHGVTVEPELVDALVDEVTGQPGALPLLSTALVELWEARTDRTMTLASYRATGGLHAAVARLAESVYTSLDPDQQQAARRMFLRLTGPGVGDTVVKRRVRLTDLAVDEDSSALVDLLARRRLLTIDDGAVEVAHEALLREWPRFADWLEEDREGIRLRAHLADAAASWEADGRDDGELYRGARLSATLDWTTAHAQDLSPVEQEFVTASQHRGPTRHRPPATPEPPPPRTPRRRRRTPRPRPHRRVRGGAAGRPGREERRQRRGRPDPFGRPRRRRQGAGHRRHRHLDAAGRRRRPAGRLAGHPQQSARKPGQAPGAHRVDADGRREGAALRRQSGRFATSRPTTRRTR